MRVLHVTPFYEPGFAYGGMVRASAGLCRALARAGHEVSVATAWLDPCSPSEEVQDGVRVHRFPGPAYFQARLIPAGRGVRDLVRGLNVDIAHVHGSRSLISASACRELRRRGIPWVVQPHGTFPAHGQRRVLKRLFDLLCGGRQVIAGAQAVLAVSAAEVRDLPRSAYVVGNGVELPGIPLAAREKEQGRLLFVGSDARQKRGHILRRVLEALPDAHLALVGRFGGELLRQLSQLPRRVEVCGTLGGAELVDAYARASVVLHPATGEAFGFVPFEAALCGTAAVVAGGHGCGELFGCAGGCVVPEDSEEGLIAATRERLDHPDLGGCEASAVAEFVRQNLSWDDVAARVMAVYREVLAARCAQGCHAA